MTVATRRSWDGGFTVDFNTSGGGFEPAVDPGPTITAPAGAFVSAMAIDSTDTSGAVSTPAVRVASDLRKGYRIVVGGKDVTWFRGVKTPLPNYSLVSPLLYGSGSLTFPQIDGALETPGVGELAWLKKHAKVKVQRLNDAGEVLNGGERDYVGFIADFSPSGQGFSCTLGGESSGQGNMQDRPTQIFPFRLDIGTQLIRAARRLRLNVGAEVDTGIVLTEGGGGSELDNITDLLAKSTLKDGNQWTLMPNAAGKYRVFQKDLTTVAASVYIDGFRVVEDLHRDFTEEPNRIWANAVDENGMRIRPADYPGLASFPRPPFPGTVSPGDSGNPFEKVRWRLWFIGRLDGYPPPDVWTTDPDDDITQAVEDIQDDADLPVTGVMDASTWDALFDADVTGYSLKGSQERPAAQKSYTKRFLTNSSGQVIGTNPRFDGSKRLVDKTVDMGRATGRQLHRWAKHELADDTVSNWVGTITVNTGAIIDNEHNPGDPLAAADLRDTRSIQPGTNLWLPNWDGGTLVHVSGVDVTATSVTFAVDTRARDTMPVWEVIARNRESRRNPSRQWIMQNRRSGMRDDTGAFYDGRVFGKTQPVDASAGAWVVFPVVAGRSGTLQKIDMLTQLPSQFVFAVFGKNVDADWCERKLGDPFDTGFRDRVKTHEKTWRENRWLVDVWGFSDQPCGYWPDQKTEQGTATGAVVTGEYRTDVGVPYYCVTDPVLWVAFQSLTDTTLQGGRIFELLLDDSAA
jgi:hypothetical protein